MESIQDTKNSLDKFNVIHNLTPTPNFREKTKINSIVEYSHLDNFLLNKVSEAQQERENNTLRTTTKNLTNNEIIQRVQKLKQNTDRK